MYVVGVDGCRTGWVAVALTHGRFAGVSFYGTFTALVESVPDARAIGVDIPVGVFERRMRVCDLLCRERVGAREANGGPIFDKPEQHPARIAAEGQESSRSLRRYASIVEPDGRTGGKAPGRGRVIEVPPEASFRKLAGQPLDYDKGSPEGVALRLKLLRNGGVRLPADLDCIGDVAADDVIDAAAAASSTYRYAPNQARSLPPERLWERTQGRVVAICF